MVRDKSFTLKLTGNQYKKLKRIKEKTNITMINQVRTAIEDYIKEVDE